jgi:hypothetical protein
MLIGFTHSFRMGQILQYNFNLPAHPNGVDTMRYMCSNFVNDVRIVLKRDGFAYINNNQESGGTFIVAYQNRIFTIDSDFQVAESLKNYVSVGCGKDLALGSLYTTENTTLMPEERVGKALLAAQEFSSGVRGPFNFKKITFVAAP